MVDGFDWGLLIVAASGTICAILALIKVIGITDRVEGFLSSMPKNPMKVFTPAFVAEVGTRMVTNGAMLPDGTPATVLDIADGYIHAFGPALKAEFKEQLPTIISAVMNPQSLPPTAGQSPGQQLAGQRWGGLKAAQGATKALGKTKLGAKVAAYAQEGVELAKAAVEIKGVLAELRKDAGGNGSTDQEDQGHPGTIEGVWTPA